VGIFDTVKRIFSTSPERETIARGAPAIASSLSPPAPVASERATALPGASFGAPALALVPGGGDEVAEGATKRTLALLYPAWLVSAADGEIDDEAYETATAFVSQLTDNHVPEHAVDAMFDRFAVDTDREGVETMLAACAAALPELDARRTALMLAMAASSAATADIDAEDEAFSVITQAFGISDAELGSLAELLAAP
jgi:hypothetical protein